MKKDFLNLTYNLILTDFDFTFLSDFNINKNIYSDIDLILNILQLNNNGKIIPFNLYYKCPVSGKSFFEYVILISILTLIELSFYALVR